MLEKNQYSVAYDYDTMIGTQNLDLLYHWASSGSQQNHPHGSFLFENPDKDTDICGFFSTYNANNLFFIIADFNTFTQ